LIATSLGLKAQASSTGRERQQQLRAQVFQMWTDQSQLNELLVPLLVAKTNEYMTPIRDRFILDAWEAEPRGKNGNFYDMGGADGRIYRIVDPLPAEQGGEPTFIMSGIVPERNRNLAVGHCKSVNAELPSVGQFLAIQRARAFFGRQGSNFKADGAGEFWTSTYVQTEHGAFNYVFSMDDGEAFGEYLEEEHKLLCVRADVH